MDVMTLLPMIAAYSLPALLAIMRASAVSQSATEPY
jgi:hypothetical protein